ncbi:MAG: FkbM family methyltransferase [Bacteroidota bacterium]
MNFDRNKVIYRQVKQKDLSINTVCEVGVYLPETSNIIDFIVDGVKTILVEPNPPAIQAINKYFKNYNNITLHEVAIYDREGKLNLSNAEASTFVSELPASPALVNDKYTTDESKEVEVKCVKFSSIDDGDIDLLSIDTEGSEWYVLEFMKSRPKVISVETHGKFYVNPFIEKINDWVETNGYTIWYKDMSDTVYIRKDIAQLNLGEKLSLSYMNFRIKLRRAKKVFYK